MAFDGVFLHKVICELNEACDCHIDKIYQPSKDELVFLLRKKGFVKRLYISIKSGSARIHFTENKYENPAVPPNFCMLLRKYLSSARLTTITQNGFERIAELHFSATNELGDIVSLRLICELIGNQANVILVKPDGTIIDSLRHSDIETAQRLILPNAIYEYPKSLEKINPIKLTKKEIENLLETKENISKKLLQNIEGFSPLVCREIEYKAQTTNVFEAYTCVLQDIVNNNKPILIFDNKHCAFEYSFTDINQYGKDFENRIFNSFSELLDKFYLTRDTFSKTNAAAKELIKLINNLISRTEKRLSSRLEELEKCKNRENLRIYGELLKANLYSLKKGDDTAVLQNYYDENLSLITIPLNPALSPSKNADKYFKDYKKSYTAEQTLNTLTKQDKEELVYFESVLDSINRSNALTEIDEIKNELIEAGFLKTKEKNKRPKNRKFSFLEDISKEGYRILIGKNNLQNDFLTTKLATKSDLWFHVKNFPGSHVVVFSQGGEVSEETILKAALLAAFNSKCSNSSNVAVDYTPIKYVKKPAGAKPGMVIYTTNKTVFVTPKGD